MMSNKKITIDTEVIADWMALTCINKSASEYQTLLQVLRHSMSASDFDSVLKAEYECIQRRKNNK